VGERADKTTFFGRSEINARWVSNRFFPITMLSFQSPFKSRTPLPKVEEGLTEPIPGATTDAQTGAVIEKKSQEERWFVARLDGVLLLYGCISQIIKYLDQQNISAAYVSGMKEGELTPNHEHGS
jgi:hypothetical protein